jgi:hypothetical protein
MHHSPVHTRFVGGQPVISHIMVQPVSPVLDRADVAVGLASRIDEILFPFMTLSAILGDMPGPRVAIFVPAKFSSSKKSQVPKRMIIEEMLLPHCPGSFISPNPSVWCPRKWSLSDTMIWGMSPAERMASPAVSSGKEQALWRTILL